MLRATFTKIKRACVITLVPRIVRGEGRYTTRKFGKTSVNVLRKVGKSTDSGSKDGERETDKCKRLIDYVFGPSKPKADEHDVLKGENKTTIGNIQEIHKENVVQTQTKVDINTEKQNKLLKEFVGVDEDVLRQDYDYYYKNLKLQAAAIDKNKVTRNKDNTDDDTSNTRRNIKMSQPEINKGYDDDESKWSSETSKNFEKESPINDYEYKRYNLHDIDLHKNIPEISYKLQTTVSKENKEKLSQKIQVLGETSPAKASRPKDEGFDISPKVLSDQFANFCSNTDMKTKSDFQKSLDEIAKKCMNTPAGQVDNKVMQEIEKLGISHTDEKKSTMNEDVVKMDKLRKHEPWLHEGEIDLDHRQDKRESVHCISKDKLGPSFEMPPHLDQKRASMEEEIESTSYNEMHRNLESETFKEMKEPASKLTVQPCIQNSIDLNVSRPQYDKNAPIIDPYDKKALAFVNDEFNQALMDSKLLDEQRIGKPSENEKSQDQAYKATSEVILSQQKSRMTVTAEDSMYPDQVRPVFDCAPREINWRPYPSFEAREEVMDFYNQQGGDSFKLSHTATIYPTVSEPEPTAEKLYEPRLDHIYTSTSVSTEPREQISHSFVQPEEMINPLMDKNLREPKAVGYQPESIEQNFSESFETLPSLNPDANVPLTELLKRVRMRNRMEYCREFAIHTLNVHAPETLPAEGKCGKKSPPCPPPPPKCPPPSPCPPRPPACPPPPPCPKPCKPATKQPCPPPKNNPCSNLNKFNEIRDVLTLLTLTNTQLKIPQKYLLPMPAFNAIHTHGLLKDEEEEILNGNFVFRLSILGKILLFHCTEAIDTILPRNRSELSFARDYEPWTPIPSWPISTKEEKKRFVCPKEGCKVTPPPKLNGPSKENPCVNFPKRSNFSLTDFFSFSLVESLMCHTAEFAPN